MSITSKQTPQQAQLLVILRGTYPAIKAVLGDMVDPADGVLLRHLALRLLPEGADVEATATFVQRRPLDTAEGPVN